MQEMFRRLWNEEEGQGMAEYGILLVGIAFAAMAATYLFGGKIGNLFYGFTNQMW